MSEIVPHSGQFASGLLANSTLMPSTELKPALFYLAQLSPGSHRTMRGALNILAGILGGEGTDYLTCPWHLLRYEHSASLRAILAHKYAPATANRMLSALKGVLKECRRLGLMSADACTNASDIKPIRAFLSSVPGRAIAEQEMAQLFQTCCGNSAIERRDAAMLAILAAGLRREEVVFLDLCDLLEGAALRVRHGKGCKERLAYLPSGGSIYLSRWLEVRGLAPGALLNPVHRTGSIAVGKRLVPQAVLRVAYKRSQQINIEKISPHDFRRTFVSSLLDAGVDIVTTQKLAGHATPATTARYDRRGESSKQQAVLRLHLPVFELEDGFLASLPENECEL